MYFCRTLTDYSYQEIAAYFRKDHATIIHAVKAVEDRAEVEKKSAAELEEVSALVANMVKEDPRQEVMELEEKKCA